MIRLRQIKVPVESSEINLIERITKVLKIENDQIKDYKIVKKSIDARKKDQIYFVYEVDINVQNENEILKRKLKDVIIKPDEKYNFKINGTKNNKCDN